MIKPPISNVIADRVIFPPILDVGNLPPGDVFWVDDLGNDMVDEAGDFIVFKL